MMSRDNRSAILWAALFLLAVLAMVLTAPVWAGAIMRVWHLEERILLPPSQHFRAGILYLCRYDVDWTCQNTELLGTKIF